MLYLMLSYFLISCGCWWVGILFYSFFPNEKKEQKAVIQILITGLILITVIGQWIALFFPTTVISLLFILFLCGILSFWRKVPIYEKLLRFIKRCKEKNIWFIVCISGFFLMILVLNSGPFLMDDTDSYHIQMVKWLQEYGSVAGIANLHLRFGFNSSWFVSIALFSYPFHGLNSYGVLNGVLSIWLSFYLIAKIFGSNRTRDIKSNGIGAACMVLLGICLLNWPMIRGSAASTNYDFISTCCIVILFVELIDNRGEKPVEWLIWPVYLFTVRIINFPLLILSLAYILPFLKNAVWIKLLTTSAGALVILTPFVMRNCILSGFAFFPVYQLDFFSFDWKVDKLKLIEITRYIKYFNRVNTMYQQINITEDMSFPGWVGSWFAYLFRFDKLTITLSFAGYILLFSLAFKNKSRSFKIFLFAMICQIVFWFFTAPDPRFVYGPLLFGIFIGIYNIPALIKLNDGIIKYALILTGIFIMIISVLKIIRNDNYRDYLTPHKIPVPVFQKVLVGNIELHIPEKILRNWNPRCYDIELPCLYQPDPRLEARGKTIGDGFRIKNSGNYIFKGGEYKISE